MKKKLNVVLHFIFAIYYPTDAQAMAPKMSPEKILRQVDAYRMPFRSFEASIRVTPLKEGQEQPSGTYIIRGTGFAQILVEATSFDQIGQKFLTNGPDLFFYAPRTKRAIRLTPLQSLRGQASIGDIARLSFENDYSADEVPLPVSTCPNNDCVALELKSKNLGATYEKIILIVQFQKGGYRPISASLFVASGKLFKLAYFSESKNGLPPTTQYIDPQTPKDITTVEFEKISFAKFSESLFNPRGLER